MEKGNISVNSENMFPIIKKWLYSDKDIFLREIVSNACDAITKLKKLVSLGDAEIEDEPEYRVDVTLYKEAGLITISDNGIGMTADEIKKYIADIAFSGAADFLEKYQDDETEAAQIIGHFGLGFYSAFMVSSPVEIDSLSYLPGSEPAKWVCDGTMEYTMSEGERTTRGTTITLHITDDSKEFLDSYELRKILNKYCAFMPVEIYLTDADEEKEKTEEREKKKAEAEKKKAEGKDSDEDKDEDIDDTPEVPKPINETSPLWMKKPSECTDEEYKEFYRKVFADFNEPLFWIHLNVDYPFNLKGILYFPRINHEFAVNEGQVKLYNNQVFVADNVKEVIPEFLMLLKGVIDCPDLPLNVSRSFLQNDGTVKKISAHITKKVADKLVSIYKNDRENYNKYWEDINIFIKYGCMREDKFYDRTKQCLIYKTINGDYITLDEYLKDKDDKNVYYVSDESLQSQYINMFKEQGLNAVIMPAVMDNHFMSFIESKEDGVTFHRIDSEISAISEDGGEKSDEDKSSEEKLVEVFKKVVPEDTKVEVKTLKNDAVPAVITLSEQSRRMREIYQSYGQQMAGMAGMFKDEYTVTLNAANPTVKKITELSDDDAALVCEHIYDLAMISNHPLSPERMTKFIERSNKLLGMSIQ